jgi:S-adenosyl-L-methionine hydrolase (adenosine-forming)
MGPLPITFLSDYGYQDEFAGVCRAVIAGIAPAAAVIDLTHGIAPGDVRHGALALANAIPYSPAGIHLAVVDPGVGTSRRPVAVRAGAERRTLVGPDNGLLAPAIEALGGPLEAVDLSASPYASELVSASFHGRDIFAPVAAQLALGARLSDAGEAFDAESLASISLPRPIVAVDHVVAHVLYLDRFGNAALDARRADLEQIGIDSGTPLVLELGERRVEAAYVSTFGDVPLGEALLYENSSERLAIAINRGDAGAELGLGADDQVVLRAA